MNVLIKVETRQPNNNFRWITSSGGTIVKNSFEINLSGETPEEITSKAISFFEGNFEQKVELVTENETAKKDFKRMSNNILCSFLTYPTLVNFHESNYFKFSASTIKSYDFNI